MLKITQISRYDQLLDLENEWNRVLERSRDDNFFLTWEWCSTYWKYFEKGEKLMVLHMEDEDEIIAIFPLKQSRFNLVQSFGYEVIRPIGHWRSDYNNLILTKRAPECIRLFLNYLYKHDDWDFLHLIDIPQTALILNLLPQLSKVQSFELKEGSICPYISIPNSIDTLMYSLSKKMRNNLRRCIRNLEKDYRVEFKTYDELGSVEETTKILFELHQKRWKSKGMLSSFKTSKVRDFTIDLAKQCADKGWLALCFLVADDEPVSALLNFEYKQKAYAKISAFDPEYSRYSVCNLAHAKYIEKCIQKGIKEYDFLKGDELYKFRFTKNYRRNFSVSFVRNRIRSKFLNLGRKSVERIKMKKILEKFLKYSIDQWNR